MIAIVVRSRGIRSIALQAARRVQPLAETSSLGELPAFLRHAHSARCLIIHDFLPDTGASIALLKAEWAAGRGFSVLALLASPATPFLDALGALPCDFPLCGMVIAGEEGAERLAERIKGALARGGRRAMLEMVVAAWRLDPVLARVAECELTGERPHTTLEGLLREAGVGRRSFVQRATNRGLTPPLRFLQALRVMEAAELLQQGCTTRRTAERLSYGSLDTLRRHFRLLAGMTPRAARALSLGELAAEVLKRITNYE